MIEKKYEQTSTKTTTNLTTDEPPKVKVSIICLPYKGKQTEKAICLLRNIFKKFLPENVTPAFIKKITLSIMLNAQNVMRPI